MKLLPEIFPTEQLSGLVVIEYDCGTHTQNSTNQNNWIWCFKNIFCTLSNIRHVCPECPDIYGIQSVYLPFGNLFF